MISETEVSPGNESSIRVSLKTARRTGVFMIAFGCALVAGMFIMNSRFELLPFAIILATGGPAMITGVSYAKAIQKKSEGASDV